MGNIGPGELLIIALIAILLFGAGRLADIGKGLGQGIKNFKQGLKEADEINRPPGVDDDRKRLEGKSPPAMTAGSAEKKEKEA